MSADILNIIEEFPNYTVAVIGEAMLDCYFEGSSDRICREAPVPVVVVDHRQNVPGGAANTAVNVCSLGGRAILLSVIGDDPEGKLLVDALQEQGVDTEFLIQNPSRVTLAKNRVIAGNQMVVRFDQGTTRVLDRKTENELIHRLVEIFPKVDALIISDYGYGILTPRIIQTISELQSKDPRVIVADSKKLHEYASVGVTAVKPNYEEAVMLLGMHKNGPADKRPDQMSLYGERILEITGAQIAAVTLDEDGALIFEQGQPTYRTYAKPAPHTRAAGAGDTFVSTLTMALVAGVATPAAAELASASASIVVGKVGTAACYREDLKTYFSGEEKFVMDAFYLAARVASYRRMGKRIVFTNGCFDILHRGHIAYLNSAKSFGDVLIVGINSDESVRRLKGDNRPINSLEDRGQILAALSCVDHIIPFDTDTPADLIKVIQPDVYVKGGDYTRKTLPEAPIVERLGGKVEILPYLEDHSTSSVIERIRKLYAKAG